MLLYAAEVPECRYINYTHPQHSVIPLGFVNLLLYLCFILSLTLSTCLLALTSFVILLENKEYPRPREVYLRLQPTLKLLPLF